MLQSCPSHHITRRRCAAGGLACVHVTAARICLCCLSLVLLGADNYAKVGLWELLPMSCCEVPVSNCTWTFLGNNAHKYQAAIG